MKSPKDRIIVKIEKKFSDEIKLSNGGHLFIDPSWNPEQHVTVSGTVVAIPDKVSQDDDFNRDIELEVKVGDTLIFSYLVVFDRVNLTDPSAFFSTEEFRWQNQDGDSIEMGQAPLALTGQLGKDLWVAVCKDKSGEVLDSEVGSRVECENWLTRFRFTENDEMAYANCLIDDLWLVDYKFAILSKRGKKMIPIGGYVLMEPVVEELNLAFSDGTQLILPEYLKKAQKKGFAKVKAIGSPRKGSRKIEVGVGDQVVFDPKYAEKYVIDGKEYELVKQHRIHGKVQN